MARKVNMRTVTLITQFEGCKLTAYRDPAGMLTIGFGHTGPDVKEGLTITEERAVELLHNDLSSFEAAVDAETSDVATTDDQFGAMVSLAYNIGVDAFRGSTVLRMHRLDRHMEAANAFCMWDKATVDGKLVVMPGLVRRRQEEKALYLSQEPSMDDPKPVAPAPASGGVNLAHVGAAGTAGTSITAMLTVALAYHLHLPAEVAGADAGIIVLSLGALSGFGAVIARKLLHV